MEFSNFMVPNGNAEM